MSVERYQCAPRPPLHSRVQAERSGLHGLVSVVGIRPFRRLWLVLGLSSLGDWLGLLATATFASAQVSAPAAQGVAFASVIAVRLLPALALGPLAGVLADRFDRRHTMVIADGFRFLLFASIPSVGLVVDNPAIVIGWAAFAIFLVEAAGMVWVPAKEAAVPNLLPRDQLETANQITLVTTYGITPVLAAAVLAGLTRLPRLDHGVSHTDLALYFDALTFLASALVVLLGIKEISGRADVVSVRRRRGVLAELAAGWRYVGHTPIVRGLVVGVLGAFAGGGVVIGTARFYAISLGGGEATFAILFAALFVGLGLGITGGPPLVGRLSRRRWFGLSIVFTGAAVASLALAPELILAVCGAVAVGAGAGMAFLSGVTLLGGEVADEMRGRVFAVIQTGVRVTLLLTISAASVLVGLRSSNHLAWGALSADVSTSRVFMLAAGACGIAVGLAAFRQMDDRKGTPVLRDVWTSIGRREG